MDRRREFIDGLRALADWYEAHPEVPPPCDLSLDVWLPTKEELVEVARLAGGSLQKGVSGNAFYYLRKEFRPGMRVDFFVNREAVCERKVVGTRTIPARPETVLPAQPEREEEILEWVCAPLLPGEAA